MRRGRVRGGPRWPRDAVARRERMRRGATCGLLLVLAVSGGARAQDDDVPQLRFWPGLGVGFLGLSLELNVEGQRWYGGAQLAAAASYSRLAVNGYVGVRAGAFLSDAAAAPFVGAGVGYLYQNPLIGEERGADRSDSERDQAEASGRRPDSLRLR